MLSLAKEEGHSKTTFSVVNLAKGCAMQSWAVQALAGTLLTRESGFPEKLGTNATTAATRYRVESTQPLTETSPDDYSNAVERIVSV